MSCRYNCNITNYIQSQQHTTAFNLVERVQPNTAQKTNDILIEFDGRQINQERFIFLTEQLSDIITNSGDVGEFEYDIFNFKIKSMQAYQNNLIKI